MRTVAGASPVEIIVPFNTADVAVMLPAPPSLSTTGCTAHTATVIAKKPNDHNIAFVGPLLQNGMGRQRGLNRE